jgi:hypothetical protein
MENNLSTLRNCLVTDCAVKGALPVAEVKKGLLYNNLFYGDSAHTVVRVSGDGLALNNTIVSAHEGTTPLSSDIAANAQNNIALVHTPSTAPSTPLFAPYMTSANSYTLPDFLQDDPPLAYQLHERSTMINTGVSEESLPASFDTYKTDKAIDFAHDRDVLGNPRLISTGVDMGALETWYVAPATMTEITALTDRWAHTATETEQRTAYLRNYGGNYYPHQGSVVYIMDSASLVSVRNSGGDTLFPNRRSRSESTIPITSFRPRFPVTSLTTPLTLSLE